MVTKTPKPEKTDPGVTIGDVLGGISRTIIAGRDIIIRDSSERRRHRNRRIMLDRVKKFWIEGVLEQSVHNAALIELGKQEEPEAVGHPWDMQLQEVAEYERHSISQDKPIIDIFDEMGHSLLILGAPGSGKTITLLELARDAIARAENDPEETPIPVVFNLSSWTKRKQNLADWMLEELNLKYQIPKKIGRQWIENNEMLLLLDGLDEVKQENRTACVEAINRFRHDDDYGINYIVVCSRSEEYENLSTRLVLEGAILLQPLTFEQIDSYLVAIGSELVALRTVMKDDVTLQELAKSPLMLSIMTLAYRGLSEEAIRSPGSLEERRNRLFNTYTERMMKRRGIDKRYSLDQTIYWLSWLARMMSKHSQMEFFIEEIQPTWLQTRIQHFFYDFGVRLVCLIGLILAMALAFTLANVLEYVTPWEATDTATDEPGKFIIMLVFGLAFGIAAILSSLLAMRLPTMLAVGLTAGLMVGLFVMLLGFPGGLILGLVFGILGGIAGVSIADRHTIKTVEKLSWSWKRAVWGLIIGLAAALIVVLALWLAGMLPDRQGDVLGTGLPIGLTFILVFGLTHNEIIEIKTTPNQGIRQSARNAIRIGLGVVFICLLFGILVEVKDGNLMDGMIYGLLMGLPLGFILSLIFGGAACIQHTVLRLILICNKSIPQNLVRFLDYTVEHIFLRKIGGGYIFIHRLLLDYFAGSEVQHIIEQELAQKGG